MDANSVVWTIGFPTLLFLVAVGVGTVFAMTSSDSAGFLVAKACLAAAAFDLVAVSVYWVITTRQPLPWNVGLPLIAAVIAVPALVLTLQWVGEREALLSTQLFPGDEPSPPMPIKKDIPANSLKIFLGSNMAWSTTTPHTILTIFGEQMLQVDRVKSSNRLVISILKIFDDRNNIIARLDADDGFWVENSTRKKRPDSHTLVVYDHTDTEVLRVVFMNPTTLYITGIFRHQGLPRPVVVTPEYMDLAGRMRLSQSLLGARVSDILIQ